MWEKLELEELRTLCGADELHEWRFSALEAALIRLGKNYCHKKYRAKVSF